MANSGVYCKLLDSAEAGKLTDEIVKLTKEFSADSDELSNQIEELLKNYPDPGDTKETFGVGGVKVIQVGPSGSAKPDSTVSLEKDGVKVFVINPDKSKKLDEISELNIAIN